MRIVAPPCDVDIKITLYYSFPHITIRTIAMFLSKIELVRVINPPLHNSRGVWSVWSREWAIHLLVLQSTLLMWQVEL